MKTNFSLEPHTYRAGSKVIALFYDGEFIGQITEPQEGAGAVIFSKYPISVDFVTDTQAVGVYCVRISIRTP